MSNRTMQSSQQQSVPPLLVGRSLRSTVTGMTLGVLSLMVFAAPVMAHHPLKGRVPANLFEGILSGLAHPILGPDHFAFVVAAGLLAVLTQQGIWIPVGFCLAGLAGTGLHLMQVDLPAPEFFIALSVLTFGLLLALRQRPQAGVTIGLGAIAGLFHGYAYGEAIIGATMMPLVAYLVGFTCIQLAIALVAYRIGKATMPQPQSQPALPLRFAGFVISGAGAAFLSAVLLG